MKPIKTPWRSSCGHEFFTIGCKECREIRKDLRARDEAIASLKEAQARTYDIALLDQVRDTLDELLLHPDYLPISSAIGNELEAALEHVINARMMVVPPEEER